MCRQFMNKMFLQATYYGYNNTLKKFKAAGWCSFSITNFWERRYPAAHPDLAEAALIYTNAGTSETYLVIYLLRGTILEHSLRPGAKWIRTGQTRRENLYVKTCTIYIVRKMVKRKSDVNSWSALAGINTAAAYEEQGLNIFRLDTKYLGTEEKWPRYFWDVQTTRQLCLVF